MRPTIHHSGACKEARKAQRDFVERYDGMMSQFSEKVARYTNAVAEAREDCPACRVARRRMIRGED